MHGDLLVLGMILLFGCIAFIFGVIYLTTSFFSFVWRTTLGSLFPRSAGRVMLRDAFDGRRVCPRANCRKVEHRAAKFCSQCGARMD